MPYGNTYSTSGAETFQYTGKQLDVPTGLYYYGYRYYDSQSGRFITQDTTQPILVAPQTLNRFSYALNNPSTNRDLDGRQSDPIEWLGPVIAAGILGPEALVAAAAILGIITLAEWAYNAYNGSRPPGLYYEPPNPVQSPDQLGAAAEQYMEHLRVQRLEASHIAKEVLDAVEHMLEGKMKDFGLKGPPDKVHGGWI